ncbi:hypothetical protein TYRP_015450 [Tyrophagus putrescentiae]|nr:hypothetical protein TYRP_015450 [Tyrophagus putrescentiae]
MQSPHLTTRPEHFVRFRNEEEEDKKDDIEKQQQQQKQPNPSPLSDIATPSPSGYNLGVVNTPEETFKGFFNASLGLQSTFLNQSRNDANHQQIELLWSVAVSLLLAGAILGCLFTSSLADRWGRRTAMLANSMTFLLGVCLCWASKFAPFGLRIPLFMAGRLVIGLGTGVASSLVPMYLGELAPPGPAGAVFSSVHIVGLAGGQPVAMALGLESVFGCAQRWELLFVFIAGSILLGLLGLIWMAPESPVFLYVMAKKEGEAVKVLSSLRTLGNFSEEIAGLKEAAKAREMSSPGLVQLLKRPSFRSGLLALCVLHGGQQLVGINAINYYSTKTFRGVGLSALVAQYSSIGCSVLSTCSIFVSIPLIKRVAKRKLTLASAGVTILCLLLLTASMTFKESVGWLNWATILFIVLFVFCFNLGIGPIPFLIGADLFDQSSMAVATSIGCLTNWCCNFVVAITFPIIVLAINQYVFLLFLAFNVLLFAFVYFKSTSLQVDGQLLAGEHRSADGTAFGGPARTGTAVRRLQPPGEAGEVKEVRAGQLLQGPRSEGLPADGALGGRLHGDGSLGVLHLSFIVFSLAGEVAEEAAEEGGGAGGEEHGAHAKTFILFEVILPKIFNDMGPPIRHCRVCFDSAIGYNYNGQQLTCKSCRMFFYRNAHKRELYKCTGSQNVTTNTHAEIGHCPLTVTKRKECPKCRLEKCFSIGMTPPLTEQSSTLEKEKTSKTLLPLYRKIELFPQTLHQQHYNYPTKLGTYEAHCIEHPSVLNNPLVFLLVHLRQLVAYLNSLPLFRSVVEKPEDRRAVAQAVAYDFSALRYAFTFDPQSISFEVIEDVTLESTVSVQEDDLKRVVPEEQELKDNIVFVEKLHRKLGADETVRNLLSSILVARAISEVSRSEYSRYLYAANCYLLRRYLEVVGHCGMSSRNFGCQNEAPDARYRALMALTHIEITPTRVNYYRWVGGCDQAPVEAVLRQLK